jgi:hypothetical protein
MCGGEHSPKPGKTPRPAGNLAAPLARSIGHHATMRGIGGRPIEAVALITTPPRPPLVTRTWRMYSGGRRALNGANAKLVGRPAGARSSSSRARVTHAAAPQAGSQRHGSARGRGRGGWVDGSVHARTHAVGGGPDRRPLSPARVVARSTGSPRKGARPAGVFWRRCHATTTTARGHYVAHHHLRLLPQLPFQACWSNEILYIYTTIHSHSWLPPTPCTRKF